MLDVRTALVTGGVKGIGKAIADRLRVDGWRVLTTSHDADAGADFTIDLSESGAAVRLYAQVLERLKGMPPDALVNNAALLIGDAARLHTLNFETPSRLTMLMGGREAGIGAVVNILDADALGRSAADDSSPYHKSKLDLRDYTLKSAAMFVDTLRVNAVAPGPISLPAGIHLPAGNTPLGRPTAADVADAVAFLLSATKTTGAILPVDGGYVCA